MPEHKDPLKHITALCGCGKSEARRIYAAAGDDVLSCNNAQEIGNAATAPKKRPPVPVTPERESKTKP